MLDFSQIKLNGLAVHRVGNKYRNESNFQSAGLYAVDEALEETLFRYFLKPFKSQDFYRFHHGSDLAMNEVYTYCKSIFESQGSNLYEQSEYLLQHLYEKSNHPNIKSGELFIAYFKDAVIEDEVCDAVGIFKSENKHTFLESHQGEFTILLNPIDGINIDKMDKGSFIFNTDSEYGFKVLNVDTNSVDALYWVDHFMKVQPDKNEVFYTKECLNLCRNFANEVIAVQEDKKEEVLFLNRSVDFLAENESFNLEKFTETVVGDELLEDFNKFRKSYANGHEPLPVEDFEISKPAVTQAKRTIKNSIKLDTNVNIKIGFNHKGSGMQFVEKGFDDEKGMSYYKVYFNRELH